MSSPPPPHSLVFPPADRVLAPVSTGGSVPIERVFCVGRNYADHAAEMGSRPEPVFFMKPATAIVTHGQPASFPIDTAELHHEIELAVVINGNGRPTSDTEARTMIYGYAAGLDLTRRDVQSAAKSKGGPWETAKAFDQSAPLGLIAPVTAIGHPRQGRIWCAVQDEVRQDGDIRQMLHTPEALMIEIGKMWSLRPGDLVLTGTPAGVGPIARGQTCAGGVDGVGQVRVTLN